MPTSDYQLLEEWQLNQDATAFAEIVSRYAGLVFSACHRILGNAAEAEEIAQDCFVAAAGADLKVGGHLGAWLYRLAVRRSLNRAKMNTRRRAREQTYVESQNAGDSTRWEDIEPTIDAAIERLPDRLRLPIVLHYLEGRSQESTAHMLTLPRTTVSTRISRGVELIRKELKRHGIVVTAVTITSMLGDHLVEAAPAQLVSKLGKIAVAGGTPVRIHQTASKPVLQKASALGALILLGAIVSTFYLWSKRKSQETAQIRIQAVISESENLHASEQVEEPDKILVASAASSDPEVFDVEGRVTDYANRPVEDAKVAIGSDGEKIDETTTTEDGAFSFRSIRRETVNVYAFKSGVGLGLIEGARPADPPKSITLEALGSLSGRVIDRDDTAAIPGLSLLVWYGTVGNERYDEAASILSLWQHPGLKSTTSESGHYAFTDLLPGRYQFARDLEHGSKPPQELYSSEYSFPGYQGPPLHRVLRSGEHILDYEIALTRGGAISGTVYGPDGLPLSGATVKPFPSRHSQIGFPYLPVDQGGRYRLGGLPLGGSYTVLAKHAGLAEARSQPVDLLKHQPPIDTGTPDPESQVVESRVEIGGVDIYLETGHDVHGRLIDESGAPIVGAEIFLHVRSMEDRPLTDNVGAFSFSHIGQGKHRVSIFNVDRSLYDLSRIVEFEMTGDSDLDDLVITLRKKSAGYVSGRVFDENGSPVGGARVVVSTHRAPPGMAFVHASSRTDDEGRYRVEGLGAATQLGIDVYPGNGPTIRTNAVEVNSSNVNFEVLRYGSVQGHVVDGRTGEPVKDFRIRHMYLLGDPPQEHFDRWMPTTSETGTFRIGDVSPPVTRLEVRTAGYAPGKSQDFEIDSGEELTHVQVRLDPGVRMDGRVVDANSGQPLPGVRLRLFQENWFHPPTMLTDRESVMDDDSVLQLSDEQGQFVFNSLSPVATMNLVAWHDGLGTKVFPQVSFPDTGSTNLTITMAEEGRLMVRIDDPPVECETISVSLEHRDGDQIPVSYFQDGAWTTRDGQSHRAEISALPAGRFKVGLRTREREHLGLFWADVEAGSTTELMCEFEDFGSIHGTVPGLDPDDNVYVWVGPAEGPSDEYASASCDQDGRFEINGLPAGDYAVVATRYSGEHEAKEKLNVTLGAAEVVTLDVEFSE